MHRVLTLWLGRSGQLRLCKGDEMVRLRLLGNVASVGVLTAALLVGVFVSPASACSCAIETEAEQYQRADHVFTGTVRQKTVERGHKADPFDDLHRYAVRVHKVLKGEVPRHVNVITTVQSAMCGIELTKGAQYLIFSFGDSSDRRVETNLCSGTRLVSQPPGLIRSEGGACHVSS
ncbi:tissue inhibitor of metalloproteinase [Lentzea atacamensis]|uniref:Tissue inhibitor of metalloproteinase n=1 Tax=Lentzea atacamensis TaxID=531938 RepID=A0A316HYH3_9PSEU|nr:tissue inhibitor of metalloproteinase [Lentzea atacamensis]